MEHEGDGDTNCKWCARNNPQWIGALTGRLGNKRTSANYLNDGIKIGRNTEKSPGDLRRLAVTQTPVKDHQLALVWTTLKGVNDDDNKKLEKLEIRERIESIQTIVLLRSAIILRKVLETCGDLLLHRLPTGMKNSQGLKLIMIIIISI